VHGQYTLHGRILKRGSVVLDAVGASILTKQTDLVALAVSAHQEFITIHDMFIEVPKHFIALTFHGAGGINVPCSGFVQEFREPSKQRRNDTWLEVRSYPWLKLY